MDSLYTRYANALLSIAIEENRVDYYRLQIKALKKAFLENEGIVTLLSSAFIEFDEKERIIDHFYDENENIKSFLKIIVRNRRSNYFIKIFNEFIKSCNETIHIKDGIVYSVHPLSEQEIDNVEKGIGARLDCQVELENVIDERLIGGVKVMVEDKIFDGSIKNKVEKLKESLIRGGA